MTACIRLLSQISGTFVAKPTSHIGTNDNNSTGNNIDDNKLNNEYNDNNDKKMQIFQFATQCTHEQVPAGTTDAPTCPFSTFKHF